jgi:NADPH:quinone reductase-like Zn-dependent oxidoreductase
MKAVYYTENGGPDVLTYGDVDAPAVKANTVLIRVRTISIEGGDLLNRSVTPPRWTPYVGGYQAAGIVEAVGEAVTRFRIGQPVVGFNWSGSHAELFAVPEQYAYPVPEGMDIDMAAIVPIAFGTASDALFEFGRLQPGETVLVQGAAGGVGLAAVQLASRAGATVIGTAAGPERLARIAPFGMHHGIDYRTQDIAAEVKAITGGKGADLVLDLAGGHSTAALINAACYRGRYTVIGASSGLPSFGFFELIRKSLSVYGISFGAEMHTSRAHALLANLMRDVSGGHLVMPIEKTFPLSQARDAHDFVANGHPFGRVLMKP